MKKSNKNLYIFQEDGLSFISQQAAQLRSIYMPLCGIKASSLKSSITPNLSGDIKISKDRYLTKPVSREDLRENVRDFFVRMGTSVVSLTQTTLIKNASVEIGPFWHKLTKKFPKYSLKLEAVNFIPSSDEHLELMKITVTNISQKSITIQPTASIPIFGRSLSNKHDHEHVTSLLHRTSQVSDGVLVEHVMAFDEEGHRENDAVYYVFGSTQSGGSPIGSFPTRESFLGESGTLARSLAIRENLKPRKLSAIERNGKEAMGALRFSNVTLRSKASVSFIIAMGITSNTKTPRKIFKKFNTLRKFNEALKKTQMYWRNKSQGIEFFSGNDDYNSWFKWVTLQPILRRIFGCSFLPDHDYGKGGKGWRDIWQDLLSLILIEPQEVRGALINNFAGVRIDGSNATIIGAKPGEFIADRNKITRVWMDHGAWPLMTLALYIDQTGDIDILLKNQSYFRDVQLSRTYRKDDTWNLSYGQKLKNKKGKVYRGTIIEHLLIQQLVQFFNVGEHNLTRLESADWNDGLDMGFDRGESVAFTSFYGGNLFVLADLLEHLSHVKKISKIVVAKEVKLLLDSLTKHRIDYKNPKAKRHHLYKRYFSAVQPELSGVTLQLNIFEVVADLRKKGEAIFDQIKRKERVQVGSKKWFNGYYDNKGRKVEGKKRKHVRMTLTGQVFPIMGGLADEKDIREVIKSVNTYLKDRHLGGYRLNTDFGINHYLDLGRAFGFAYGAKENGAFFSHMIVMYAYALYKRGFAKEGYHVLQSIYAMCQNTQKSQIYPGIPEYFDSQGRGMYHYLTGSASWLVLTQLTQVFGVVGKYGDLVFNPKLMKEEFGKGRIASVSCSFASKRLYVRYHNPKNLDYGHYKIKDVLLSGKEVDFKKVDQGVSIKRYVIQKASKSVRIDIMLGA